MAEAAPLSCRSCAAPLDRSFVDLGLSPISNALRAPESSSETVYLLRSFVCGACRLVQLQDVARREDHFHDAYTYFSSYSQSWLDHARRYAETMTARFGLGADSLVAEVASNDGYLLQYFREAGIPVLGIDPAANCAEIAQRERGVPTIVTFFGAQAGADIAAQYGQADLIAANNVLAHVPDLNDFVAGFTTLLKPGGVVTFEFPHLLRMIEAGYFDTIYHEHYSYLSLLAVEPLFARHGLAVFDLEELPTHGGSLRLFVAPLAAGRSVSDAVLAFRAREQAAGLESDDAYLAFAAKVRAVKRSLLRLLCDLKESGASIVAYGAPAKGVTLLNYCGIGSDFIDYAVDRSPHKQGFMLPGTGIPIHDPATIFETRPDYLLILPWNLKDEIMTQMAGIRDWGGRFVLPLPDPVVLP